MHRLSLIGLILLLSSSAEAIEGFTIDHHDTHITSLSQTDLQLAKDTLNIVYGHASHGSQLTTGMDGLVEFANGGGLGLSLPTDFFAWNNGGTGGALDLHNNGVGGSLDLYPLWLDRTIAYLDEPANAETNVVIWSWCGQHVTKYRNGTLESEYLTPMSELEIAYPEVVFVYMTGHVNNGGYYEDTIAANNVIRNFAAANNKVLYDFADIEHYDPDELFFEFVTDYCDYFESSNGPLLGNWAIEWQDTHTQGYDWYECVSAHSQPLNANRKAYAAWDLWVEIAKRMSGPSAVSRLSSAQVRLAAAQPNPFNPRTTLSFTMDQATHARLEIYDVCGRRVAMLVDKDFSVGEHKVIWDGRGVAAGTYLVRLETNQQVVSRKISLVR